MRVYVPATAADLAAADGVSARLAHAVTPGLRSSSPEESEEDLEVPAFLAAAAASLAALTAEDVPVRVVVSADVDDAAAVPGPDVTQVRGPAIGWSAVVSIHVDDPDDARSQAMVSAAVGGDDAAVAAADELDLLWYDASEREELVRQLDAIAPDRSQ